MTPYLRAIEFHRKQGLEDDFYRGLSWHVIHGVAISTPDVFLLMRPVPRDASAHDLWECEPFGRDECDTWHVWLAAGDMSQMEQYVPYPLPCVSYVRKNRLIVRAFRSGMFSYGRDSKKSSRKTNGCD